MYSQSMRPDTRGRSSSPTLPSMSTPRCAALLVPVVAFPVLYALPWNPIYAAIMAMALGGAATIACRPDLTAKTFIGGALFAAYYATFMLTLKWSAHGYIERVWNLHALSGITVVGIPLEELLFGFAFGTYWSGIYEHLKWQGLIKPGPAMNYLDRLTPR